jgi:predicted acetyltransferase
VLPTHRRRGILRALMTHQLHEIHARGREPLAVLWASEPMIYGRFGYGLASRAYGLEVPRSPHALRADVPTDPRLRLRFVAGDDWKITSEVYAEAARRRPGMLARDERWWQKAVRDVPSMRDGRSALRCVIAEDDDGVRGYARYSTQPDWTPGRAQGTVHVREVMSVDAAARALLYGFLFDQDLMDKVDLWNVPEDDPLLLWLHNLRATKPRWFDALYLRLVDLPSALRARSYQAPLDVVLDVTDPVCPWNAGRWALVAGGDQVTCELTDRPADLSMSVTDLAAAYLGGTLLADLATAGRIAVHSPAALTAASLAFQSSPAPWCPVVF